mmetsp:Transcript_33256/g.75774  ORF Transcript_33256/g.75774 Transcript_33256/m.75774 type:complete len:1030 (-) Transcript_33256:67-3156(-)
MRQQMASRTVMSKMNTLLYVVLCALCLARGAARTDSSIEVFANGAVQPAVIAEIREHRGQDVDAVSSLVSKAEIARRQNRRPSLNNAVHVASDSNSNHSIGFIGGANATKPFECATVVHITEHNAAQRCPDACPFLAAVDAASSAATRDCHFMCVAADGCGTSPGMDPNETIADDGTTVHQLPQCRSCSVLGCGTCDRNGEDKCKECKTGYLLSDDGKLCIDVYSSAWNCVALAFGLIFIFFLCWLARLWWCAKGNEEALQQGLQFRSRQKLRVPMPLPGQEPADESGERGLFPLSTNLWSDARFNQVAGPGVGLHVNFMWLTILWGCIVAVAWGIFAGSISIELFILGWRDVESKHQFCTIVQRGHRIQEQYMWNKALFLLGLYLVTFILFIAHAIQQQRHFVQMNVKTESMRDYAALLWGLPKFGGDEGAEEKVRAAVAEASGEQVVGISIMWDVGENAGVARSLAERVLYTQAYGEEAYGALPGSGQEAASAIPDSTGGGPFAKLDNMFKTVLGVDAEEAEEWLKDPVSEIQKVKCCGAAWAVFETEEARDRAVEKVNGSGGLVLPSDGESGGNALMEAAGCEPETVRWGAFQLRSNGDITVSLVKGIVCILIALFLWAFVFYIPFAYYSVQLASVTGAEEAGWDVAQVYFTITVVLGNQLMYYACDQVADGVGFRYEDQKMAAYVVLYTLACFVNVLLDLVINYGMVRAHLFHIDAHTASGLDLRNLTFQETFESFPMQGALGRNLFNYAFPACMLLPFLMEPVGLHMLPLQLQAWLVRGDPSIVKDRANRAMSMFAPMDLGRYADCLLNLFLGTAILFFPGGLTLPIFIALAVSHLYIYFYDKWKVLRAVPAFVYASNDVDECASMMLSGVTALILMCAVFKGNCAHGSPYCYEGMELAGLLAAAGLAHIAIHAIILKFVVPALYSVEHDVARSKYQDVASATPCSWFSASPMHCLRSYYIHKHNPPQLLCVGGNEHLLRKNPSIAAFFECKEAPCEDFTWAVAHAQSNESDGTNQTPLLAEES